MADYKTQPVWLIAEGGKAAYCQHNVDCQIHCCLCHDGFIFAGMQHDPDCSYYDKGEKDGDISGEY